MNDSINTLVKHFRTIVEQARKNKINTRNYEIEYCYITTEIERGPIYEQQKNINELKELTELLEQELDQK